MKTLVVIFGQVRTLSACIMSIYEKILLVNRPCSVVLAIDGKYQDIPKDVLDLLNPFLIDIYVTHNKEDHVQRDNQGIEFSLVSNALERVNCDDDFDFILKVRTDIFVRYPVDIRTIYGMCSQQQFEKNFLEFSTNLKMDWTTNLFIVLRAYLLTGALPFFVHKQTDELHPPISPWSTKTVYEWNADLFEKLEVICGMVLKRGQSPTIAYVHNLVKKLYRDFHVVYLIGSTWIHFGYARDIANTSRLLVEKHATMKWPTFEDEDELEWVDHKGQRRSLPQKEWMKITDDQMRMVHHLHGYSLMDLVNPEDYRESFDAVRTLQVNKKRPDMFAWIVRSNQI